jgi:uncharacterized protein (TIGR02145 family)
MRLIIVGLISAILLIFSCSKKASNPDIQSPPDNTVTDVDGNTYTTVKIGNQVWMAENLKVAHYRNGDAIPNVTEDTIWYSYTSGATCNYDNNEINVSTYGRLYNWYAVNDNRGLAPEGWHIPTDEEWKELELFMGMSQSDVDTSGWRGTDEGGKLKEMGTSHWIANIGATNEVGFSALPGGYRIYWGAFMTQYFAATFWTSTEDHTYHSWFRYLGNSSTKISRDYISNFHGCSIRCIKD